jgi:hypothetical protein
MTYIRAYDLQRNEADALLYCQELEQVIGLPDVSQEPKYAPYLVLGSGYVCIIYSLLSKVLNLNKGI